MLLPGREPAPMILSPLGYLECTARTIFTMNGLASSVDRPLVQYGWPSRFDGTQLLRRPSTMRPAFFAMLVLTAPHAFAQPGQPPSPIQQAVQRAMASDIRTPEERARDRERQPAQVLDFFRLRPDMRVIEILPFSGWYTKILGTVLEDGKLYVTHPSPTFYSDAFAPVRNVPGLEDVEEFSWGAEFTGGTPFFASGPWDVEPVDLVVTFRNYHNFSREARMAVNKSSFDALKPGGLYGIVDHTRRHMEPDNSENGRRVDPVAWRAYRTL
jgi:predicted methyltransferase